MVATSPRANATRMATLVCCSAFRSLSDPMLFDPVLASPAKHLVEIRATTASILRTFMRSAPSSAWCQGTIFSRAVDSFPAYGMGWWPGSRAETKGDKRRGTKGGSAHCHGTKAAVQRIRQEKRLDGARLGVVSRYLDIRVF